jgi:hypothetical protein
MPTEVSFEQRFGQLVDAELNEKLPTMIEYRVGFQVVDKADDETKAIGVYVFVLNNVWLYIPVFFIDGKLEGFELLYLKQKDLFIPAQDNWIAAINERGLQILGQAINADQEMDEGINATPENTNTFISNGSMSKIAADKIEADPNAPFGTLNKVAAADYGPNSYLEGDKDAVVNMFRTYSDEAGYIVPDLSRDLPMMGKLAKQTFVNTMVKSPDFANALLVHYDLDRLEKLAKECVKEREPFKEVPKIQYVTSMRSKEAQELSDKEKQLLVKNDIFIKDHRTNFSQVYHEEVDTSVLQNLSCPGVYDVLMQDGSMEPRIVLVPKVLDDINSTSFMTMNKTRVGVDIAVIDPSNPKGFERRCSKDIYGRVGRDLAAKNLYDQQGGIKATKRSLRDIPEGAYLLFVNGPKECFVTSLKCRRKNASGDIVVTLRGSTGHMTQDPSTNCYPEEITVHFVEGGKLALKGDMLFVPASSRVFVDHPIWMKNHKDIKKGPNGGEISKVDYGTPNIIRDLALGDSQMGRVEIKVDGNLISVKDANGHSDLMQKKAAFQVLCEKHGIKASQAMQMVKEAAEQRGNKRAWMVKYAAPYDTEAYKGAQLPFMGGPSGTADKNTIREEKKESVGKPLTNATAADGSAILPGQAIEQATQASQAGVKEVLDVEVLKQLLDKADISELRKDYIAEMIQGMDRVGRMLFIYYWHNDEFEEKYGKEQMNQLKEKMVQVFQATGDLILFLKEKTAFNPDQNESLFGSLSEDVASAG